MNSTDLAAQFRTARDELDRISGGRLLVVVPLLLVVVGACVMAAIALLLAAFAVSMCGGVVVLARRAIHAATYERTDEVPDESEDGAADRPRATGGGFRTAYAPPPRTKESTP